MDTRLIDTIAKACIPVLDAAEIKQCDQHTINSEPISGTDLMERASRAVFNRITSLFPHKKLHFICGPGNNGGDGLCMAAMARASHNVRISLCLFGKKQSTENEIYAHLVSDIFKGTLNEISNAEALQIQADELVVDCLFGTGLSAEITGEFANIIEKINASENTIVSVDVPSGLFTENTQGNATRVFSHKTIAIQCPKKSFFFAENKIDFDVVNAGIKLSPNTQFYLSPEDPWCSKINALIPEKDKFSYKGNYGHALLVGGNNGMHGAIALAAEQCLKEGAGLTTVLAPAGSKLYLAHLPKAMHLAKPFNTETLHDLELDKYTVLAAGPGMGNTPKTADFLQGLLKKWNKPCVLDADALNILALHPQMWEWVEPGSVLTPHPGEFKRLFGPFQNGLEMQKIASEFAQKKQIYILAKNTYSTLFTPEGHMYHNGSGGPWLAQGGSGDQLTGKITGLWARTQNPHLAALCGCYRAGCRE